MFSKLIISGLVALSTVSAFAIDEKSARENDVATKYILEDDGDFFRMVKGKKCQITTNVDNFKISAHKNDVAMLYFKKDGDLHILRNNKSEAGKDCPKADVKVLVKGIKKYTVVSNASATTEIVNLTLDHSGKLLGWDNTKAVITATNIKTYQNNECFGAKNKSFKSYAAFAISNSGRIVKIKGNEIDKKVDPNRYTDIEDFIRHNNVCEKQG